MASQYAATFRQTCYRQQLTGTNTRGEETFGSPEACTCRAERQPKLVRDSTGAQVVATGRIFTETQVLLTDLLFPPGADPEDVGTSVRPISVADAVDLETGQVDHYEVYY